MKQKKQFNKKHNKKRESKFCVVRNTGKNIGNFYKKYREFKQCNIKGSLKHYYENKDKLSSQRKVYYEKLQINFIETKQKLFKF